MAYRIQGEQALLSVLSVHKNVTILENMIHRRTIGDRDSEIIEDGDEDISKYRSMIFQAIGDIIGGCKLKDIAQKIKEDKLMWNHDCFDKIKSKIKEQDDFITNPIEVSKGVVQCNKCGSHRVFSYSKQVRSSDEAISTFCQCIGCKAKWVM